MWHCVVPDVLKAPQSFKMFGTIIMLMLLFSLFKIFYLIILTSCQSLEGKWSYARFEVRVAALLKVQAFSDVTLCCWFTHWHSVMSLKACSKGVHVLNFTTRQIRTVVIRVWITQKCIFARITPVSNTLVLDYCVCFLNALFFRHKGWSADVTVTVQTGGQ
jgi:hypothetical protein